MDVVEQQTSAPVEKQAGKKGLKFKMPNIFGLKGSGVFKSQSIIAKVFMSIMVLVVSTAGVNLYVRYQISLSDQAVKEQAIVLKELQNLRTAAKAFGDTKYWYSDLANSLSDESEEAASKASKILNTALGKLSSSSKPQAEAIKAHVKKLAEASLAALDEYVSENRDKGNKLMANGRKEVVAVDGIIQKMEARLTDAFEAKRAIVQARASEVMLWSILGIVVPALLAFGIGILLVRQVVRPVQKMTKETRKLANGELDIEIAVSKSQDEIGQMARALKVLRDNLREAERMREESAKDEEITRKASHDNMMQVADKFEEVVSAAIDAIGKDAGTLQENAGALADVAKDTDQRSASAVNSAQDSASNLQSVASAAEELTASISQVVHQITESSDLTRNAVVLTTEASQVVGALDQAGDKIDEIVELIDDIAEKTNLLALNATIEAARAGDAGKGFAVVASEVKNLAVQTTSATTNISSQIQEIKTGAKSSVSAMEQVMNIVGEIENRITTVASAAREQNDTTQEISKNVHGVAENAQNISQEVSEIAKSVNETGQASQATHDASTNLSTQAESLRTSVSELISQIRTAG